MYALVIDNQRTLFSVANGAFVKFLSGLLSENTKLLFCPFCQSTNQSLICMPNHEKGYDALSAADDSIVYPV